MSLPHPFRQHLPTRAVALAFGAVLLGSSAATTLTTTVHAQRQVAHPAVAPRVVVGPRVAQRVAPIRRVPVRTTFDHPPSVFAPGYGPFTTFPFGRGFRGGLYPGYGVPGLGGDTTARSSASATASPRSTTAIINGSSAVPAAPAAPSVVEVPTQRLTDAALEAAGVAASGGGEGAAQTRRLLADIAAAREADRLSRRTGSRYIYADDDLRELAGERAALRREEGRGRNPHILYLGFDK